MRSSCSEISALTSRASRPVSDWMSTSSALIRSGQPGAGVVDVGDPAAHPGGEVAAGLAEDDDAAAGHVLAAVLADALDDRQRAGVADREALAGEAAEEGLAAGGAVEDDVAGDHVLGRVEARAVGRADREDAAGEALADVVVRLALELERDPRREPGAEALAGRAAQADVDRVARQAGVAVAA